MDSYREQLSPSWWMILATALFVPATLVVFLPLSIAVGLGVGALLWLGSLGVLWVFSPVVSVDRVEIRAGKARIERTFVGSIEVFSGEDARAERGVRLDARAWLVLRPWIDPVVKISVSDPDDPTPYWLVSCRRPELFIDAWSAAPTT